MEIKDKMLFSHQLKFAHLYNFPISNVIKLVPNFFHKVNYVLHYENLQVYLRLGMKLKKYIAYQDLITMAKVICRIQHIKKNRSRKKW